MTPDLNTDNLPVDPDLLLAYIEDAVTPEQRIEVRSRLRQHPELAETVESMRRDRVAVAELPSTSAPDSVIDHLATHTDLPVLDPVLGGAPNEQHAPDAIPVSKVQPARISPIERWRKPIAYATAASVLAVVGLSTAVIIQNLRTNTPVQPDLPLPGPIAGGITSDPDPAPNTTAPIDHTAPYVIMTLTDESDSPHREPESLREALDLARAGQLAIRVRTSTDTSPLVASRSTRDSWRLHDNLDVPMLSTLGINAATSPEPIYADGTTTETPPTPPAAPPMTPQAGLRAEIEPTTTALASLLSTLADLGDVELIWLDQPAELPPTIDEADIAWWNAPPSTWVRPIEVPIAIYNPTP